MAGHHDTLGAGAAAEVQHGRHAARLELSGHRLVQDAGTVRIDLKERFRRDAETKLVKGLVKMFLAVKQNERALLSCASRVDAA